MQISTSTKPFAAKLLPKKLTSFGKDDGGVAAVEFALILPIMAVMFIGAVEMSWAVGVDRRVSQVAGATGDLVARVNQNIKKSEVVDIMKIGSYLMYPFDEPPLKVTTSIITSDVSDATKTTKRWECVFDASLPSSNQVTCTCPVAPKPAYTVPANLMGKNEGLVVSDVQYKYKPLILTFDFFMKGAAPGAGGIYTLKEKLYLKPRALWPKLRHPTIMDPAADGSQDDPNC